MTTLRFSARSLRAILSAALVLTVFLSAAAVHAQPTAGPDYIVGQTLLPDVNKGDVAYIGTDMYVGVGAFAAGGQSILRVAPDGTTETVVTNLNSIGGVDYNADCDVLLFTDNAFSSDPNNPTDTGETVYGLPAPRDAVGPIDATTLELLPAESIPSAANVLGLPDCTVLVSDAAGGTTGRVVKIDDGVASDLITGLGFSAGLSLTNGGELMVGDVTQPDPNNPFAFVYTIRRFDQAGTPLGDLTSDLSGAFDHELDVNGNLILSGGFDQSFASTLVSVTPGGTVDELATGYGFTSGVDIDKQSGQIAVLDFGVAAVDTLTPVAALTEGGRAKKDCQLEWWGGKIDLTSKGKRVPRWTCHDGDACDRDGEVNGACTFLVGACFAVDDTRFPKCVQTPVDDAVVKSKKLPDAAAALQLAVDAVLPTTDPVCTAGVAVTIPVSRKTQTIGAKTIVNGKRGDRDRLGLRCREAGA